MEKRLQQIARDGQRAAQNQRRNKPRQADLQQNAALRAFRTAAQDFQYFRRRQPDAAREKIPDQKNNGQQKEQQEAAPRCEGFLLCSILLLLWL